MESRQVTDLEVKATKVNLQYETPDRREKSRKDSPFDPFQVPPLYTLYPSMPMIFESPPTCSWAGNLIKR
jgi:hypothetical protein